MPQIAPESPEDLQINQNAGKKHARKAYRNLCEGLCSHIMITQG